ncbi:MAG: tetraacyldisaccharide 4'-kinase, partial [Burkholderiales bacterium]|nr:tetraacyldisaccharide 4'-kinase [Burkholderiales bacterium]
CVDAIIVNVSQSAGVGIKAGAPAAFAMALQSRGFYNLLNPDHKAAPEQFLNRRVHAVAGIGNPQRFFELLQRLGLTFTAHSFPDHHAFSARDLAFADADLAVMTEKDAVKCRSFATEKHWVLRVDAEIDPAFGELILKKLGK